MVPSKEHNPLSPVSTRVGECQSRLSLPIPNRQNRLAPQPNNISSNRSAVGTPGSRPFCHKTDSTVTSILQLETRSRGGSSGCICTGMDQNQGFCSSAMVPHSQTQRVQHQRATLVLIAPMWPTQPWYSILLSLLIDLPLLLPNSLDKILPSPNCDNPMQQSPPQLAA